MNFIEELKWRNMLHDSTPGIEEILQKEMCTAYIGFDPTAPSLTIGNYVQIMILSLFQRSGHRPIFLLGGATGRIGDPSGKDKERLLKSYDELETNLQRQKKQAENFLDFGNSKNAALMVNNLDFYNDMNALDFLRNIGKSLTVNYMLSKDSVKNRLQTGLSFTEFSYQLLQAYDFQCLYQNYDCKIQMGGSDQWGNIISGTDFIRKNIENSKAHAVTTPLLTKADGSKFGKSAEGNIWLDSEMTSTYKFYQFWINSDDADVGKFFRYFSYLNKEEIEDLEKTHSENPRLLKKILAQEITTRVHSAEEANSAQQVSTILFNKKASKEQLMSLKVQDLNNIANEIPGITLDQKILKDSIDLDELLVDNAQIFKSKSEMRRAIQNNALSINKSKISDHKLSINLESLLCSKYIFVENGKKNKFMIELS